MPVRTGRVTTLAIDPDRAMVDIKRPNDQFSTRFEIYDDSDGASVSQLEMLRRGAVLALLQRAFIDEALVSVYEDDKTEHRAFRVELAAEMIDDSDLATTVLLSEFKAIG